MLKPSWINEKLAGRYEIGFMSGPKAPDQDWRRTEIREIPATRDQVDCVFVSRIRGERIIRVPTKMFDDELFLAAVWDRFKIN